MPEAVNTVLSGALQRWKATAWVEHGACLRALELARRAADLCLVRGVLPELRGSEFVTEVVITPPTRSVSVETITYSHGPMVVVCEYGGEHVAARLLVEAAAEASIGARGWAPIYVKLWEELLRGS